MKIVKHEHPRLLLFDAVDYGQEKDLVDQDFVQQLRKEGTEMSVGFGRKYYNPHYEEVLRLARDVILGVINLGLVLQTSDKKIALTIILRDGILGLFKYGFTKLTELSDATQSYVDVIKKRSVLECCMEVSYTPNSDWKGHVRFCTMWDDAQKEIVRKKFIKGFVGEFGDDDFDVFRRVETRMLSHLTVNGPRNEVTVEDVIELSEILYTSTVDDLRKKLSIIAKHVGVEYEVVVWTFLDNLLDEISNWKSESGDVESIMCKVINALCISSDVNDVIELEARAMKDASTGDLLDKIEMRGSGENVIPIVKNLLKRCNLTIDDLSIAIERVEDLSEIDELIQWEQFSQSDITSLFSDVIEVDRFGTLVSMWARSTCHKFHGDNGWGRSLNIELVLVLTQCDVETVWNLSQDMALSYEQLMKIDDVGRLSFLLEGRDIFEFYMNARSGEETLLFDVCREITKNHRDKRAPCIAYILNTIIFWMKKDGIKKTDEKYYDDILRKHFELSVDKDMIKFIFPK